MTEAASSLAMSLEEPAEALGDVERVPHEGSIELRRAGRPFARLDRDRASFRLDPVLVAAAIRTADTSRSPLGAEWVAFAPATVDRFALDRAEAWLEAAWRRAGPAGRT
ncbi:MAG TPA: hypothetical protein VEY67_11965 [Candidatus Dormibacteraeota bacterium]|nr:hypothetical protein [Candidatus Dormibacteraeota bacterium]